MLIPAPWVQVTKRFLLPGQKPAGKSRFADLFRVSFRVNPEPMIQQGMSEQPEVYQRLSDEFMASLKGQLEMFEDVDVVIDAARAEARREFGPGGPAIGESRLRPGSWAHGADNLAWGEWSREANEIALVGDGEQAASVLTALSGWWRQGHTRLFLVCAGARPFEKFLAEDCGPLSAGVHTLLHEAQREHEGQLQKWEAALAEWQQLDDFVQAKKPRPEQPIARMVVFSGHMLTAVDQLVDKTRTFLTLETSPFVVGEVQPENNQLELKTIGVDRLIGATGTRRAWQRFHGLDLRASADQKDALAADGSHPEVGFFTLGDKDRPERRSLILAQLQKLFSPAGGAQS